MTDAKRLAGSLTRDHESKVEASESKPFTPHKELPLSPEIVIVPSHRHVVSEGALTIEGGVPVDRYEPDRLLTSLEDENISQVEFSPQGLKEDFAAKPVGCKSGQVLSHKHLVSSPTKIPSLSTLQNLLEKGPGWVGGSVQIIDEKTGELIGESDLIDAGIDDFDTGSMAGPFVRRVSFWFCVGRARKRHEIVCERPWTPKGRPSRSYAKKVVVKNDPRLKYYTQEEIAEADGLGSQARRYSEKLTANNNLGNRLASVGAYDIANKIWGCGHSYGEIVCKTGCGKAYERPLHCGVDRLCHVCSESKIQERVEKIDGVIKVRNVREADLSMLTLTVLNTDATSKVLWGELVHRFNMFRALLDGLLGRVAFSGGCRSSEVTYKISNDWDERTGEYHPHLHCLVEHKDPIPQRLLSDLWLVATEGAGYVCDIRRVRNLRKAANETVKSAGGLVHESSVSIASAYMNKIIPPVSDAKALLDIYESMTDVRLFEMFGTWRNIKAEEEGQSEESSEGLICMDCEEPLVEQIGRVTKSHGLDSIRKRLEWSSLYTFNLGRGNKPPPLVMAPD